MKNITRKIMNLLMVLSLSLVTILVSVSCNTTVDSGNREYFGFEAPESAIVTVGSEYEIPVPGVKDKKGNLYEVGYEVTLGNKSIPTAGGIFIAREVGDYKITFSCEMNHEVKTITTVVYARKLATLQADRDVLYVGERVTAEGLGLKAKASDGIITDGFELALFNAEGKAVTGAVPNEGDYVLNVKMMNDTYYTNTTLSMEAVDAVAIMLDIDDVMVGENVDLSNGNPRVVDRLTNGVLDGYDFTFASETAVVAGSIFTATDACGQKVTVTATKQNEATIVTTITIPTYATSAQTEALYNELSLITDKNTAEYYAKGVKLQHYYDSLSAADKNGLSVSEQQVEFLAGGVEYGSGKLVYFDTAYGQKQLLNVTDHSGRTGEGEFIYETNKHEFVYDSSIFVGENGALKLNALPALYSIKMTIDTNKIPYDLNELGMFGFKIYHNGRMTRTDKINVGIQLSTATKKDVQASVFKTGFSANREVLVSFNFKDFNLNTLFGEGTTVDDLVDMSITIYDGTYTTSGIRKDFYCYVSPVYAIKQAKNFTVSARTSEFRIGDVITEEHFSISEDIDCGYMLIDPAGNGYVVGDGYEFVKPGKYDAVAMTKLPYSGNATCSVTVSSTAEYLDGILAKMKRYPFGSDQFNALFKEYSVSMSVLAEGEEYDSEAKFRECFSNVYGDCSLDNTKLFDLSNEMGLLELTIFDQTMDSYRMGDRNIGKNYSFEQTDIFREVTGQESVLKFTEPKTNKGSILIKFADVFATKGTKPSDYNELSFYISSNFDTAGYTWNTLSLDFVGVTSGNARESVWQTRVSDSNKGKVVKVTINAAQLRIWGDSWDNAMLWIYFADAGRWELSQASDNFYLYISSFSGVECEYVDESKLFDLSNATGTSALTIYDQTMDSYRGGTRKTATNYSFEATDIFSEVTGQEAALKFTKPTTDRGSILFKLSSLYGSTGTKPSDYKELVFYILSNHDTAGYTWNKLQLKFEAHNSSNGNGGVWSTTVKDSLAGQIVKITIGEEQLLAWGDSWNNAMLWIYFADGGRWDLGQASNNFYLYISSITGTKADTVDETKLFDLSNSKGAAAVTVYDQTLDSYRNGTRTVGTNYIFEVSDIFKDVTGQEKVLKFTKPQTDKGSILIRLSELFGSKGTIPSELTELTFYIKSNHDTSGYTHNTLQLDFNALNGSDGSVGIWTTRISDSLADQIVEIKITAEQLQAWGDSWDNALIWISFVDDGRWDLGQASDDFYLYMSSITGVIPVFVDETKLFDLSNAEGASALTIYDQTMDAYRGGERIVGENYSFVRTDIFKGVTGQNSALKFTKPLSEQGSIMFKLSDLFGASGTKPADYDGLVFYIKSNHDTAGYAWPKLQLDIMAMNSIDGSAGVWKTRISDSKAGQIIQISISKEQMQAWGDSWDNALIWIIFADGGRWDLGQASNDFYLYISSMNEHFFNKEIMSKETFKSYDQSTKIATYYKSCECGEISATETFEVVIDESVDLTPLAPTVSFFETNGLDNNKISYGFNWYTLNNPYHTMFYIKKQGAIDYTVYDNVLTNSYNTYLLGENINNAPSGTRLIYVSKIDLVLDENTTYIYKIVDEFFGDISEEFILTTASLTDANVKFAAYTDTQGGDYSANGGDYSGKYFFDALSHTSSDMDFYIHSGDIVEQAIYEEYWRKILDDNRTYLAAKPLMAVAGNHETNYASHAGNAGKNEMSKYFNYNVPAQDTTNGIYYSYTYGNVKFINLNTNPLRFDGLDIAQYDWLVSELENNDKDWIIVNMHCPLYAVGSYGVGLKNYNSVMTEKQRDQSIALRNQLSSLFAQYGVDLVIQGHDHLVSKTYPIGTDGNPVPAFSETINGISYDINPRGTVYVMNGTTGNQSSTLIKYAEDLKTVGEERFYNTLFDGYKSSWAEYEITGNTLTVKVLYYDDQTKTVKTYYEWGIKKDGFVNGPDGYNEFNEMQFEADYCGGDEIVLPAGLVFSATNADKFTVSNNRIILPLDIAEEFDVVITADYSSLGEGYGIVTKTFHVVPATIEHKVAKLKLMDKSDTPAFVAELVKFKEFYDSYNDPGMTYAEALAEIFEGYTVSDEVLFDLSNHYGVTGLTIYNENMTNYRTGASKRPATNYTFEETDIFKALTGQTSAIRFTKPTNGTNTGLQIKLAEMFASAGTKPTDFDELVFYIKSNFDTKGYEYSSLQLDFVALNAANGQEYKDGWKQRVKDNNKNGQTVRITINRAQLEKWGDSWDNAMIWVYFVTGGRWDLGLASNDFYLYMSSIVGNKFESVDDSKLFDLSNATGATAVTIYNENMTDYRTGASKRWAANYTFEETDIFTALTGQEAALKFTKPTNGTDTGLQIKLSEKFGSTGTKPTDFDELVFYIKSNFDTKGYTYPTLQLDFVALNGANGQEYSGGWRQRVSDSNKNGQTVKITINRAQLEKWGDSWDNAMIWVLFVTGGRWDLGLASNDFYLYMSSIVGNKFESVDDSKLFDLSNATGATAVTIYNENMTDYRTGASKRWAANYTFEETDIFTALTGQEAALKFTKPTNGTDTGLQIRLSEKFGSTGTKPTDFDELVFYIKSNFDTKGYDYPSLQLDFVALNAANGQEYSGGWRQRVSDSNKNGQIVKITIDRAQLERWGDSWDNAMIWVLFVTGGRWDLGLASNDFYLYISSIVGNTVDKSKLFDLSNETGATAVTIYNENMTSYRNGDSKRLATNYTFEETDIFTELTGQETALKFTKPTNGDNTGLQIKLSEKFGSTGTKPTDYNELVFYIKSNFDTKGYDYPSLQLDFVALDAANGQEYTDGWRQRVSDSNKNGTIVEITINRAQLERWGDSWDNAMIWVLFVTGGRWDLGLASNDFYLYISSIVGNVEA